MSQDRSTESSDDQEDVRPNRWNGAPSTWKQHTEGERGLAASLDQIRNADLSIHLYNAHALKLRAKEYEESPETARVNDEHPAIPGSDRTFLPPKSWTAWPLPPEEAPRSEDDNGYRDSFDAYTLKRKQIPWPSRELEDELLGVTLKLARKRFESRESESENDIGVQDSAQPKGELIFAEDGTPVSAQAVLDPTLNSEKDPTLKEGSSLKIRLTPIVSLDDEKSRELLRPSIRHTLTKLDEVLVALHHARKTARRYSQSDAGTTDEERASREVSAPAITQKRPKGRPRSFVDLPDRSRVGAQTPVVAEGEEGLFRVKTARRGRPLKTYEPLKGETEQEYMVRIAKMQKKPIPNFAAPLEVAQSPPPSPKKSKSPSKRATVKELKISRQKKLGLRDWSEVLGAAALVGFPPEVIARATQRCAKLFGEGMEMRTLPEVPFSEKEAETTLRYVPDMIPDYDAEESAGEEDDESSSPASSDTDGRQKRGSFKGNTSTLRRQPKGRANCFCIISGCSRKTIGFPDLSSLKRHLRKNHKISPDDVDDYVPPSDEEMDGAVHIDGYLKPNRRIILGQRHPGKVNEHLRSSKEPENEAEEYRGHGQPSDSREMPASEDDASEYSSD